MERVLTVFWNVPKKILSSWGDDKKITEVILKSSYEGILKSSYERILKSSYEMIQLKFLRKDLKKFLHEGILKCPSMKWSN